MDERLDAGRAHLQNGDQALSAGRADEAKAQFEAALLHFRGPELRLGEAHAVRGLAQVDLAAGRTTKAERAITQAIAAYQGVCQMLDQLDPQGLSEELRDGALDGEGAARVVFAEVLVRTGRGDEADQEIRRAQEIFGDRELPGAAGVWIGVGRLALRAGRYDEAEAAFERALSMHARNADLVGQVSTALALAEVWRVRGNLRAASETLQAARSLVRARSYPRLEGRVVAAMGSLMLQFGRLDEAREHYYDALALVREGGDLEMEGYALLGIGDIESRTDQAAAFEFLLEGARIFGGLEHEHGFAGALLRTGEHAFRVGHPQVALAAAEAARLLWSGSDPVRGVGQALRLVVKSLAELKEWPAALTAAVLRARVAGEMQPNAVAVAEYYCRRAPVAWVAEIDQMSVDALAHRADALIAAVLAPILAPLRITPADLREIDGALVAIESLVAQVPRSDGWDAEVTERHDSSDLIDGASAAGEPAEPGAALYDDLVPRGGDHG